MVKPLYQVGVAVDQAGQEGMAADIDLQQGVRGRAPVDAHGTDGLDGAVANNHEAIVDGVGAESVDDAAVQ